MFIGLVVVIGGFWWLLADWLLKTTIETVGTKAVGAKVELSGADLTFSPLGFHLDKLQITDPEQPMQNLFELDSATGNLELLPLFMGQVIIDELSATGMRFGTKRAYSGAINTPTTPPKPEEQEKSGGFDFAAVKEKLPSVDDIMARESLRTVELSKSFREHVKNQREELEKNIAALPDDAVLKQHEQRIKELTGSKIQSVQEFQQREKELQKLKDRIRADRDHIKNVLDQLSSAKEQLNQQYQALQKAPEQDWDRIKSQYGLDSGIGNIARVLFGDAAKNWYQRLRSWTNQVQRLLPSDGDKTPEPVQPPRGEGRLIHFASSNPLPDSQSPDGKSNGPGFFNTPRRALHGTASRKYSCRCKRHHPSAADIGSPHAYTGDRHQYARATKHQNRWCNRPCRSKKYQRPFQLDVQRLAT